MNWPNLALMKGQQAPAPSRVQAEPSSPVHIGVDDAPADDAGDDLQ